MHVTEHHPELKPHPTRNIPIKMIAVDEGMIPVVNWLNSFESVTTSYCCQGGPDPHCPDGQDPYIVFHCWDKPTLVYILVEFRHIATVEIEWFHEEGSIRYTAHFRGVNSLAYFRGRLEKGLVRRLSRVMVDQVAPPDGVTDSHVAS